MASDDFTRSFLHFSLFSFSLWVLVNSRPVHSLMLSSHLFLCLPCLLLRCLWPDLMNHLLMLFKRWTLHSSYTRSLSPIRITFSDLESIPMSWLHQSGKITNLIILYFLLWWSSNFGWFLNEIDFAWWRSQDSSVSRAPDLSSKGYEFNFLQEWQENVLFQRQLSMLTLILCSFHPRVTAVALKETLVILPKVLVAGYT